MACTESSLRFVLAAVLFAMPAAVRGQQVVPSPPAPTSRVLWEHDGVGVEWFEVRVDDEVHLRVEAGDPPPDGEYEAPLPLMVPGPRTLVVAACNRHGCAASAPVSLMVVAGPIRWTPWRRGPSDN